MKTNQYNSRGLITWGTAGTLMICSFIFLIGFPAIQSNARSFHQPEAPGINAEHTSRSIQRVRLVYTSQIGAREKQANSGPEVKKYLRYVGLPSGQPWCAAFVCWVYGQAGVANPKSAWSPDLFRADKVIWKRNSNKYQVSSIKYQVSSIRYRESDARHRTGLFSEFRPTYNVQRKTYNVQRKTYNSPQPADIFALWFPEKNRIAHTGFIDQWGDTWLITVEGNTNTNGGREGDGVYRKRRLVRSIYQAARYVTE